MGLGDHIQKNNSMTYIINNATTATFDSKPTPEQVECVKKIAQHFSDPVDVFLYEHREEITAPYRALLRESAAKSIRGKADINLNHCPAHLRDELLDIIVTSAEARRERIAAEYKKRCGKQKFETGGKTSWL